MPKSTHHSVRHLGGTWSPSESLVQHPLGETPPLHNAVTQGKGRGYDLRTFLVESDGKTKGRVTCLIWLENAGVTPLQEFNNGKGLPNWAVLTGIMERCVSLIVSSVSLHTCIHAHMHT